MVTDMKDPPPLMTSQHASFVNTQGSLATAQKHASNDTIVVAFINPKLLADQTRLDFYQHCTCTNLTSILNHVNFFQENRHHTNGGLYNQTMIYIPGVVHVKNEHYGTFNTLVQTDYLLTYLPDNQDFFFSQRYRQSVVSKINNLVAFLATLEKKNVIVGLDTLCCPYRDRKRVQPLIEEGFKHYPGTVFIAW